MNSPDIGGIVSRFDPATSKVARTTVVPPVQVFWDDHYLAAVRSDANDWKFGYRLEDLEQRISSQREIVQVLLLNKTYHHGFCNVPPRPRSIKRKLQTVVNHSRLSDQQ